MTQTKLSPFGELLRRHRREQGLTQEALAEYSGLSARGIRALEQGERNSPHKDTVLLLADALKLSRLEQTAFEEAARPDVPLSEISPEDPPLVSAGFLGALPAGQLIGRDVETVRLRKVIEDVERGIGRVVMFAGEPGIGKTRLAQETTLLLRDKGVLVATGQCYEPERTVPYYPFLEALTIASRAATSSLQQEIPVRWPHLEKLLPARYGAARDSDVVGHDIQQVLFWEVGGFLEELATAKPVAVLLDDLHWADESTLRLFQHLARHLRPKRVLLLGTYRDVDVSYMHPLEQMLRDLHRDGLLEEILVRRLDQLGTARLTASLLGGADISDEFAELLHRRTGGNPFFAQEVVRALVERGDVFRRDGTWDRRVLTEIEVPRSLRSAIGERVCRLGEVSRDVLREASVLGQTFFFGDLQAMGDRTEEEIEGVLARATMAGLMRVTEADEHAFSHALVRQVLYDELSPRARMRLHRAAGEALERLPERSRQERAPELAWHFMQSHEPERSITYSLLAGDGAAAVFAHAEAEQNYLTALDLSRAVNDPALQAEVLHKLSIVLRVLGRYEEALVAADQAVELYRAAGDYEGEAKTMHHAAFIHYYRGDADRGIARLGAVLERYEQDAVGTVAPHAMADLYAAMAICLWSSARYVEIDAMTRRAEEMAGDAGAGRTLGIAKTMHGMALTMVGSLPQARDVLEAAIVTLEKDDRWWLSQPWGSMGRAYLDEGDHENSIRCLERSREVLEAAHDPAELAWIVSCRGEVSYVRGEWSAARTAYTNAIEMARAVGADRYLTFALLHDAELCAIEGDWERAEVQIGEGLQVASECEAVPSLRKGQRLLAERDVIEGRPQRAVDRLMPLLEQSRGEWPRSFPPPILAEAYLLLGHTEAAHELVAQRIHTFRAHNSRRGLAVWLRVQGMILTPQRMWQQSERSLEEAISIARTMVYPHAEGRSLLERGLLHIELKQYGLARERLHEASAIFERLGAQSDLKRTVQILADLA